MSGGECRPSSCQGQGRRSVCPSHTPSLRKHRENLSYNITSNHGNILMPPYSAVNNAKQTPRKTDILYIFTRMSCTSWNFSHLAVFDHLYTQPRFSVVYRRRYNSILINTAI